MAKRHYESNPGVKGKGLGSSYYDSYDEKRRQERMDGSMIHEDRSAVANLPQQVIMKEYPKAYGYMPEVLDDTIRGVDAQMGYDAHKRKENFKPKKV